MGSNRRSNDQLNETNPVLYNLETSSATEIANIVNPVPKKKGLKLFLDRSGKVLCFVGLSSVVVGLFPLPVPHLQVYLVFGGACSTVIGAVVSKCVTRSLYRQRLNVPLDLALLRQPPPHHELANESNYENSYAQLYSSRLVSDRKEHQTLVIETATPDYKDNNFGPLFGNANISRVDDQEERKYTDVSPESVSPTTSIVTASHL